MKNYLLYLKTLSTLFFFFIFISNVVLAQTKDYQYKQGNVVNAKNTPERFLGISNNQIFLYNQIDEDEIAIEKYDKNMNFISVTEMKLKTEDDKLFELKTILFGNTIYIFAENLNPDEEINELYVKAINPVNLSTKTNWKLIGESKYVEDEKYGKFIIHVSKNSQRLLIGSNQMYKEDILRHIKLEVFDEKMEKLHSNTFELPFDFEEFGGFSTQNGFTQDNFGISDDGGVYLFGFLEKDKLSEKDRKKGLKSSTLEDGFLALEFDFTNQETTPYLLTLEKFKINSIQIDFDKDFNPHFVGYVYYKNDYEENGMYYLKINKKTKEIVERDVAIFTNEFILRGKKPDEIQAKTIKSETYLTERFFEINNVHITDDGSIYIVTEQTSIYESGTKDISITHYLKGDVIVVCFKPADHTNYLKRISKLSDVTKNSGCFGCTSTTLNNKLYLFFNDNTLNDLSKNSGLLVETGNKSKLAFVMCSLDSDENFDVKKITDNERNKTILWSALSFSYEGVFYFYQQYDKFKNISSIEINTK